MSTMITLHSPLDMHLHVRDEAMLRIVAPLSAQSFVGGLIMPNLVPPVSSLEAVRGYRQRIESAIGEECFVPYMSLFYQNYSREFLMSVREDILAIKLYPSGVTTNSDGGVAHFDIEVMRPTLEAMSELGIPLCVHGESNGFVMDREKEFMNVYAMLAEHFPKLKIIMEHITTADAVEMLDRYPNLYATITAHHLAITLDDVAGGLLRPHLFCKPIAKRPIDRDALRRVAFGGHPKVMFGSDSAPHPKHTKESCGCGAGVFTAPIALPLLCELFDQAEALDQLQGFVSDHACVIYQITPPTKTVRLAKETMIVPEIYTEVVPMRAGETLGWKIVSID